jgi:AcrR family transcriptional regulator
MVETMAERGRPRSFDRIQALAKAMELFWEKGYEGASMAELTSVMGIGSPSLYAAFGSKEGLFREAVELYSATDGAPIWASALAAPTAYGTVEALLMTTAREFSRSDKPRGCLVILSALHSTEASATVRAELAARRAQNTRLLAEQLALGIERGELPPTVDLDALARYYITVQQGMSIQARDGADRKILESVARSALAAWQPLTQATPAQ